MSDAISSSPDGTVQPDAAKPGNGRRTGLLRLAGIFIVLGILAIIWWFFVVRNHGDDGGRICLRTHCSDHAADRQHGDSG